MRFKKIFLLTVALITADLIGCYIFLKKVQRFVKELPQPAPADAAVVFMGDFDPEAKELGPATKRRLDHALHLFNSQKADWIICVGGGLRGQKPPESVYMKRYLVELGAPVGRILNDSLSYDTETNWAEARKIIGHHGFSSIIAISAPLHLYRISGIVDMDNTAFSTQQYPEATFQNWFGLVMNIHYEWEAYFMRAVLPGQVYHRLLRWRRGVS